MFRRIERAITRIGPALVRGARLAVGVPDYATYVAHMRHAHPGTPPMSEAEFFRDRVQARYARGRSRCC